MNWSPSMETVGFDAGTGGDGVLVTVVCCCLLSLQAKSESKIINAAKLFVALFLKIEDCIVFPFNNIKSFAKIIDFQLCISSQSFCSHRCR